MPPRSAKKKPSSTTRKSPVAEVTAPHADAASPQLLTDDVDSTSPQISTADVDSKSPLFVTDVDSTSPQIPTADVDPKSPLFLTDIDSTSPQIPTAEATKVAADVDATSPQQIVNPQETAFEQALTETVTDVNGGNIPEEEDEEEEGEEEEEEITDEVEEIVEEDVEEIDEEEVTEMDLCEGTNQVVSKGIGEYETEAADGEKDGTTEADDLNDDSANENESDKESEENEEEDPSICLQSLSERKEQKEFEIFIGGLEKGAVDEDIIEVFGVFGEIQSLRIIRNPITQKSKGYAFVRYASVECAKKVLNELKDGVEIRGKKVGIAASQDNDTLYVGNISKIWTKDKVIESLKSYGIEQIEHIILPEDPKNEGKIKGFAFVEFSSHSDAMIAFQRLRKADANFGRDRSAKVAFSTSINPPDNATLQVKTVYLENVPNSWDEAELKKVSQQYGEIERVLLFRRSTASKKKDFAFVEFTSRESALACVEGMNKIELGEGVVKIQANLARPPSKGRQGKQSARGGFKINKDGEGIKESDKARKGKTKSKKVHVKGKSRQKPEDTESSKKSKFKSEGTKRKHDQREVQYQKGRKLGRTGKGISIRERPLKKSRNYHSHESSYVRGPATYEARYAVPAATYQSYPHSRIGGSASSYHDLAPHAGYLPPVKYNQSHHYRSGAYDGQSRAGLVYAAALPAVPAAYPGRGSYPAYEAGYPHPSSSGAYHPGGSTYAPHRSYY